METHQAIDSEGRDLELRDWVRVIAVPLSIRGLPQESLEAFSRAVGHTFQIEAFDDLGCLHLKMYPKISCDSIFIEPYCVSRFRRYKKLSKEYQRRLETLNAPQEPMWEFEFDARLKPEADLETFGLDLIAMGTTGSFAVWQDQMRVKGTVGAEASDPKACRVLEEAKSSAKNRSDVESIETSATRLSGSFPAPTPVCPGK